MTSIPKGKTPTLSKNNNDEPRKCFEIAILKFCWSKIVHLHCECTIALHSLTQMLNSKAEATTGKDEPRAYGYIDISKLSCRACNAFLKALNRVS